MKMDLFFFQYLCVFAFALSFLGIQRVDQYAIEAKEVGTKMAAKCVLNKSKKQAHINMTA